MESRADHVHFGLGLGLHQVVVTDEWCADQGIGRLDGAEPLAVRARRRHVDTEDVVEQPLAPQHRRRPIRVEKRDAAEMSPVNFRDAVMARQPLVEIGEIRAPQVRRAAIDRGWGT